LSFIFWKPLWTVLTLSITNEHYSHIVLIPVMSVCLLYWDRKPVFLDTSASRILGTLIIVTAIIISFSMQWLVAKDALSFQIILLVTGCIGCFIFCYGTRTFQAALFPLLFLYLMVPIPGFLLEAIIYGLQNGSAAVTRVIFTFLRVPVYREGLSFVLPGFTIHIAEECSSIRSSMALMITSLLAGHLFLRSAWSKFILCFAAVPLALVKNGIRIATLSWLAINVNEGFLFGHLHRDGGILFFLVALAALLLLLRFLQNVEQHLSVNEGTARPAKHVAI
jgi:exosortase